MDLTTAPATNTDRKGKQGRLVASVISVTEKHFRVK